MDSDDFGDRMKLYEGAEAGRMLMPLLPVCVRLDGKGFSRYTKGFNRPYDVRMSRAMVETAKFLVHECNARMGYTQSDEISLVLCADEFGCEIFFNGKIQKIVSVLASMCSVKFMQAIGDEFLTEMPPAHFDCRVWNVPNRVEAANTLLWREQDASKNSVSMAAHHYFSHASLQGKHGPEMQEMLFSKHGVNWNDYPPFFKRGTFVQHRTVLVQPDDEAILRIPEKHRPTGPVERRKIAELEMPKFSTVTNRVEVVFNGADPVLDGGRA